MKQKNIKIENLVPFARNCRTATEHESLIPSIRETGLREPVIVKDNGDGTYTVARGHRRRLAILDISAMYPDAFAKHFGKGVTCLVMPKETLEKDFLLTVADHAENRGLTNDAELYLHCKLLADAGLTRRDIIIRMGSLLDTSKPPRSSDYASKLSALLDIISSDSATEHDKIKAEIRREDLWINAHTGVVQRWLSIRAMPEKVELAYIATYTGADMHDEKYGVLPKLPADSYKKLYREKDGYLLDMKQGNAKLPNFEARWSELIADQQKPKTAVKKARKRSEVVETANNAESGVIKNILGYAAGEKTADVVQAIDAKLCLLEWLEVEKPDVFAELAKEYANYKISVAETETETETK